MREIAAPEIKGLFHHLVKAVGGVEAAGAFLEISHQRVSQLQSVNCADMPSILQIVRLEQAAGRPIVTGVLAEAATSEGGSCVKRAVVSAVEKSGKALRLVHDAYADHHLDQSEIQTVQRAAHDLDAATRELVTAVSGLQPGRVG